MIRMLLLLFLVSVSACQKKSTEERVRSAYTKGKAYIAIAAPIAVDFVDKTKGRESAKKLAADIAFHCRNIQAVRRFGENSVRLKALLDEINALLVSFRGTGDPRLDEAIYWLTNLSAGVDLIPINLPAFDLENETDWDKWEASMIERLDRPSRQEETRELVRELRIMDLGGER